jgi:hypothetical protein
MPNEAEDALDEIETILVSLEAEVKEKEEPKVEPAGAIGGPVSQAPLLPFPKSSKKLKKSELRAESARRLGIIEAAWSVIANAHGGDWTLASTTWQRAAAGVRTSYHREIRGES